MGDNDSKAEGSRERMEDSCESLESLPNREEQWENFKENPSKRRRKRLKSISMSDLDEDHHLSDNLRNRNNNSISASDLEEKPKLFDNKKNYVHDLPDSISNMGGTQPSLAESGIMAGESCCATPIESLESLFNREEQRKFCEDPSLHSILNTSSPEAQRKISGTASHIQSSQHSRQKPQEVELCVEELGESEDKEEKKESKPQEVELCVEELGESEGKEEKKESKPQEVELCVEELGESEGKEEKKESSPREEQSLLPRNGESEMKEKKEQKKSLVSDVSLRRRGCRRSVKTPVWFIVGCIVIVVIIIAVFSALLSRRAVTDPSPRGPPCEKSWIWADGRCYYFSDVTNTWNDSRDFCTRHGSTLAVLMDQEIKETIERYRENVNYWIGLSMDHNGQWRWSNGSLYKERFDAEDSRHLRCAFLNSHLGPLDCSTRRQWICVQDSS